MALHFLDLQVRVAYAVRFVLIASSGALITDEGCSKHLNASGICCKTETMVDKGKTGTNWQDHELDAIITDYFDMLFADLAGRPYVKARHNAGVVDQIGRTRGSVEFKYQNISAVLEKLGLPWIPGYLPRRNHQDAIFDAIDRYLSTHPALLELTPATTSSRIASDNPFVAVPAMSDDEEEASQRLQRLVRKFDPVERDYRNRALGRAGEAFVMEVERTRLMRADRADLADKMRWVADEDGDGAGYDIFSFELNGKEALIEVKTTNGAARTPFFVSRNECELAAERPHEWRIYRVHLFAKRPSIFTVKPPLESSLKLSAATWRAGF
ncbi:MAG TPA: DUF3883 domain-containing protein [Acidobacteriaceae bacterium]|jgi:hypothetical protein